MKLSNSIIILMIAVVNISCKRLPIVLNTWSFTNATIKAWDVAYREQRSAIDAVEEGCTVCEVEQCDTDVGYGGSPDEHGETTLDSMIMDGKTMKVGAVAGLRNIKEAISVARRVFEQTKHTLLAGDAATEFAVQMGFKKQSLSTSFNEEVINEWKNRNCQPNYWQNVLPSPEESCGPYKKIESVQESNEIENGMSFVNEQSHDTIGMLVIDINGNIAAGTSTNGLTYKIPGRVGDSPIPGSGAYADNSAGGAVATGDGDIIMRFGASFLGVEFLRNGYRPQQAAEMVIDRINKYYPARSAAILIVDMEGNYGSACQIFRSFPISIYHSELNEVKVETISCRQLEDDTPGSGSFLDANNILLVGAAILYAKIL
ncbi:N(4)-(Beta-N-acetylglucosaminyl)-L-asparaginase [Pseudolycoriella hygida]|uniref:N(4)-(beta-N-acetylglucosaminyl)-L-asparaginase n=1 Tax=Pseudolycoriella hygida TaxID=35572 RepID=A0A9Q0S5B3_9DIPT|nr:N(4)-(Beta-N-acetylglucosaminyl)-L-asparaginase [Pseudolycoriella hygida]KAJ6643990.1 N(4)-(Beta-N-acetylglucosaminyl)-L-asparaginase [Pseudolycoriella hygida]